MILAARPSMGKTALAMNIAEHIAIDERGPAKPVLFVSLEMSALELGDRLLCSRAESTAIACATASSRRRIAAG